MIKEVSPEIDRLMPLDRRQIASRLKECPRLPSLSTVNSALRELLHADQRYTAQVADVVRRDPSLTARLLRLVNSVYYGFTSPVNSVEEAVFYLGVRQIRQLALVTPIIEDFEKLAGNTPFRWREFWQHCIGTAILTREVIGAIHAPSDEMDYVAGLVHDVGKIIMASVFPEYFGAIYPWLERETPDDLIEREERILGITHAELGGLYLKNYQLPEVLVEAARFHHHPERASQHAQVAAAVQIADLLVRHAQIGTSGNPAPVGEEDWIGAAGWKILFAPNEEAEKGIAQANLKRSLAQLPAILDGLV